MHHDRISARCSRKETKSFKFSPTQPSWHLESWLFFRQFCFSVHWYIIIVVIIIHITHITLYMSLFKACFTSGAQEQPLYRYPFPIDSNVNFWNLNWFVLLVGYIWRDWICELHWAYLYNLRGNVGISTVWGKLTIC